MQTPEELDLACVVNVVESDSCNLHSCDSSVSGSRTAKRARRKLRNNFAQLFVFFVE